MRILLIDDSDVFRLQIRQILREAIPDAEIDSWTRSPTEARPSFDWRRYDLLLLDECLHRRPTASHGCASSARIRYPARVMLGRDRGEEQAVRAVKSGAADTFPRGARGIRS